MSVPNPESSLMTIPDLIQILVLVATGINILIVLWVNKKQREYSLNKEIYFKKQQISEKIVSKILLLEGQYEKLEIYLRCVNKEYSSKNTKFIDSNNTFDVENFRQDSHEIAALVEIYFEDLKADWNHCLKYMGQLFNVVFGVRKKREDGLKIDWEKEIEKFNGFAKELGNRPKEMCDKVKEDLKKFKTKNLKP